MILYHAGDWSVESRFDYVAARAAIPFLLASYAYIGSDLTAERGYFDRMRSTGVSRIFLDSGAFTAWQKGVAVELADLYPALDALEPDVYVQLDVIGDADGTRTNLERMRADGYRPLPVFTRGAPWAHLETLLNEGEEYIALGNIAKAKRAVRMEWCRSVFAHAYGWMQRTSKPLPRFHAFGVTQQDVLAAFPFYSADSSAARLASAWGRVTEFKGGRSRSFAANSAERDAWRAPHLSDQASDRAVFLDRFAANIVALNAMARHVTKVWAERGVTWPDQAEHPC